MFLTRSGSYLGLNPKLYSCTVALQLIPLPGDDGGGVGGQTMVAECGKMAGGDGGDTVVAARGETVVVERGGRRWWRRRGGSVMAEMAGGDGP